MKGGFSGYGGPAVRTSHAWGFLCAGKSDDRTHGIVPVWASSPPRQRLPPATVPKKISRRAVAQRGRAERPHSVGVSSMNAYDRETSMHTPFRDRAAAGRSLARKLAAYRGRSDVLVLALPRGGVPVAFEVARALKAPLDVFLVRKLGVPGHEELAMGAIATGSAMLNEEVIRSLNIPHHVVQAVASQEFRELERRERAYRDDRPPCDVRNHTVIVVDDGLATGATMRVAVAALRRLGPDRIVVAVPTAAPESCRQLAREADECVSVMQPDPFYAVGIWYDDFAQVTDDEVRDILLEAATELRENRTQASIVARAF